MRIAAVLCLLALLAACTDRRQTPDAGIDVVAALGGIPDAGFSRALEPRAFRFPEDHSAHPDFRNEWWYLTGNLAAENGERFAYQVTFFRIALAPEAPALDSNWATSQLWMAHVAVTDLDQELHRHAQRFARGALDLAGQQTEDFVVWLEDWRIDGRENGDFPWHVTVDAEDFALDLTLQPLRPAVLQGDQGLSQKGREAGNASYYYSITRLATSGELRSGDRKLAVKGQSWLDREWSTSALEEGLEGWDWFSLQLDSGADLMIYQLRRDDGSASEHSAGSYLDARDRQQSLNQQAFRLRPLRYWQAPDGSRYPVAWSLQVPGTDLDLRVEALLDDQLMETAVTYWEGAVRVLDADGDALLGRGFLEMTGY